jgi:glyoxylase-like metal-dependent hydrolase (beta-lactamase superfamily II)
MAAAKQSGLPQVTFTNDITINLGDKEVDAYYFGRAHTNLDAWIYFPALRVLASGDAFNNGLGTGGTGGYYGLAINYQTGQYRRYATDSGPSS